MKENLWRCSKRLEGMILQGSLRILQGSVSTSAASIFVLFSEFALYIPILFDYQKPAIAISQMPNLTEFILLIAYLKLSTNRSFFLLLSVVNSLFRPKYGKILSLSFKKNSLCCFEVVVLSFYFSRNKKTLQLRNCLYLSIKTFMPLMMLPVTSSAEF